MSSWMNDPAKPPTQSDSDWLNHLETLDGIKEESVEIKEEPIDDIADIKQEDPIYYHSANVKDEIEEIEEDFEDFSNIKPIFDKIHSIGNVLSDIKDEPVYDFVDINEELSNLPIADVFCPFIGDSHPLTIDIDKGMHSRSQTDSPIPTMMNSLKAMFVSGRDMLTGCRFLYPRSAPNRVRPKKQFVKCDFCDGYYATGPGMRNHVGSMHPGAFGSFNIAVASHRRGHPSKDEQLATDSNLPISAAEIADMSLADVKKLLKADSLTESQRDLIRKLRRRGQVRVAKRKYYKRRNLARGENMSCEETEKP